MSPTAERLGEGRLDDVVERGHEQGPVGPGILESLLWILGFFVIELAGSAVWTFGVMGVHTLKTGQVPHPNEIQTLLVPYMSWMVGTIKFAEVLAAVVAIRLRFGRHAFRLTGFRSVHPVHAVILGLAVLPTAFLGVILGSVCVRTGSLWPGMLLHALHNGFLLTLAAYEKELSALGWSGGEQTHLPWHWLAVAAGVVLAGTMLVRFGSRMTPLRKTPRMPPAEGA